MGVDINRTIALTFLIGSALAGAAGVVQGLYFGNIQFDLGFQAGLKAFTAAVLGGIGNMTGAALGGFIIGFVEVDRAALRAASLGAGGRVRRPDRDPRLPPGRPPRPAARRAGMSAVSDPANGRAPRAAACAADRRDFAERHRSIERARRHGARRGCSCRSSCLLPPFSGFSGQNVWIDGFTNAGVFVLLALGLNIVVGLAGLLDLGYAAFFAIGAYTYAFAASPFYGNSTSRSGRCCSSARSSPPSSAILLGAPTLRLRGDYLAIVTLGFGEIVPIVVPEPRRRTPRAPNGIGGIYRADASAIIDVPDDRQPVAVLPHDDRADHDRR